MRFRFILSAAIMVGMPAIGALSWGQPRTRAAVTSEEEGRSILARLQRHVRGVSSPGVGISQEKVAGRYSAETAQLAKLIGGGFLSGSSLYLFVDGRYLYTEWADVEPETIYSQGRWLVRGDTIELAPDQPDRKGLVSYDRRYALFRFVDAGSANLRLMGMSFGIKEFEDEELEGQDWHLALLMSSLERVEGYSAAKESKRAFDQVLRRARPKH